MIRSHAMNDSHKGHSGSWVLTAWLLAVLLFAVTHAVHFEEEQQPSAETALVYDFQCFKDYKGKISSSLNLRQSAIGLLVSNHPIHQIMTRIFGIFVREQLDYRNVSLIPLKHEVSPSTSGYDWQKHYRALELIRYHPEFPDMAMINLKLWMPSVGRGVIPATITNAGPSITPGRYGWFVPETQVLGGGRNPHLYFEVFLDPSSSDYERYLITPAILAELSEDTHSEQFISPICANRSCVTLLAEYRGDSMFVEKQIADSGSYVNVLWLGAHFRAKVLWLYELYQRNNTFSANRFIVLHWTPSDFIDAEIAFRQITMPRCEEVKVLELSMCKYELTPVLKYYSNSVAVEDNDRLLYALRKFFIADANLSELKMDLSRRLRQDNMTFSEDMYNEVACNWLRRNNHISSYWIRKEPPITLSIGGIFPIQETSRGHQNLVQAVRLAVRAINRNATVLANYNLNVQENDGQCKADLVMKAFIHYFNMPNVLGVLGPACSETVEPIAGISKHMNMAAISYSAEGASFVDRQAYPFFFRTIGSNRQYEDVYISLMQHFGWRRVAALTVDGQKYTEYISHMEATMKQRNLELIMNKKFPSDVTAPEMNKYLVDLKQRHAKIIIADIHIRNAELAMCEAYKLGMTASEGYVWFLPSWLPKKWHIASEKTNKSCTSEQLQSAFEGHFSIMHSPFGKLTAKMQENVSIEEWLSSYDAGSESISDYTGFAYDAVWAYALAADKLLRENKEAVKNLRSDSVVERFVELIWETDFDGLSGRVRFGLGGSRITELNIMQWRKSRFVEVGKFQPDVLGEGNSLRPNGGQLALREELIEWLAGGQPPGDGTYDCNFSALAELLGTDCDTAAFAFTAIVCLAAVFLVSLVSFLFWKQRYDKKLKQSAKIMKNFGIDLLSPSRSKFNTLDKWEIPKENVVVNRRLGEGAFGTVYGGEAQLGAEGWTAVAVKTLKSGASTEDRIDFLSEAEAMKRLDHKNIVKLLGVCLKSEPIYTIMEFMLYGDLKTYLLARRNMVNEKISDESDISPRRLTSYALDVARGLSYLADQKYVHRDLACRNCLVNSQRVVKLGDFGMARPTFESDYYRFNRKGMLPVRWMAPESLALGMFTPASDVWAFGVVLFEIITFGSYPYQGLTNNQVLEYVKSGQTLQVPIGVKAPLEGLIKACWNRDSKKRPKASDIVEYTLNYPRMVTPCLDFPGAAVEMPETESDQLELLPKIRKCVTRDSTLDLLPQSATASNFSRQTNFSDDSEQPENIDLCIADENLEVPSISIETFSPITPEGYSVMWPLLMHQVSESSDSSQTRLIKRSSVETLQQTTL